MFIMVNLYIWTRESSVQEFSFPSRLYVYEIVIYHAHHIRNNELLKFLIAHQSHAAFDFWSGRTAAARLLNLHLSLTACWISLRGSLAGVLTLFTLFDATRLQISNAQNDLFSPLKQLRVGEPGKRVTAQTSYAYGTSRKYFTHIDSHTLREQAVDYDKFEGEKINIETWLLKNESLKFK